MLWKLSGPILSATAHSPTIYSKLSNWP